MQVPWWWMSSAVRFHQVGQPLGSLCEYAGQASLVYVHLPGQLDDASLVHESEREPFGRTLEYGCTVGSVHAAIKLECDLGHRGDRVTGGVGQRRWQESRSPVAICPTARARDRVGCAHDIKAAPETRGT